ncbi:Right handed beta helix region [Marininema halotolerans]|uniref:Right handed beta helix region n=2 Tax=Marininema halotolerans TaxID=1155944 RepID=A0A1I6P056_9BACL|nr:Right handed beta helix region [Marininema halotolerans]
MITHLPSRGLIIVRPGNYVFAKDLVFDPPVEGKNNVDTINAITIASSNVQINLNGFTLSQKVTPHHAFHLPLQKRFVVGIRVLDGVRNTVIRNGTIRGFASVGVSAIKQDRRNPAAINDLTLESLDLLRNGRTSNVNLPGFSSVAGGYAVGGGYFQPTPQDEEVLVQNKNIRIFNVNASENGPDYPQPFTPNQFIDAGTTTFCENVTIGNSQFNRNTSTDFAVNGLFASDCTNVLIKNCVGNGNRGVIESIGILAAFINKVTVEDCVANRNIIGGSSNVQSGFSDSASAVGFAFEQDTSLTVRRCTAKFQVASFSAQRCTGSQCFVPFLITRAHGFRFFRTKQALFENCIANGNILTAGGRTPSSAGEAAGYMFNGSRITMRDCVAMNNRVILTSQPGFTHGGFGFFLGLFVTDSGTFGQVRNPIFPLLFNVLYGRNIARGNGWRLTNCKRITPGTPASSGIYLQSNKGAVVNGATSSRNLGNGLRLDTGFVIVKRNSPPVEIPTTQSFILNNRFIDNKCKGIKNTSHGRNVFFNNVVKNNGV